MTCVDWRMLNSDGYSSPDIAYRKSDWHVFIDLLYVCYFFEHFGYQNAILKFSIIV